ncbi:MAG: LysM peptidoglycan-binding domain-containing protein [Spirochaetales bacterium]
MDLRKVSGLLFFSLLLRFLAAEDYLVLKGESLATLTAKFHVSVESWKAIDPTFDWKRLTPGQKLKLPERHVVAAGETLYSLARKWGVEVADILALNALEDGKALRAGGTLWIPSRSVVPKKGFWPLEASARPDGGKLKSVSFLLPGSDFVSVSDGTVVFTGEYRGVGKVILVESAAKVLFGYGNFEDSSLKWGQKVTKGQALGKTSARTTERLLFFVSKDGAALDPAQASRL